MPQPSYKLKGDKTYEMLGKLQLLDNAQLSIGTGTDENGDVYLRWDATDLDILASADDIVIKLGTGTNSFDLWVYGNTASDYVLWDASANKLSLEGDAYLQLDSFRRTVTSKTGNYTLTAADSGGVFTTLGASGAVTFTLPLVASSTGFEYKIFNAVDQDLIVKTSATATTIVALNNASATYIAYSTSSEKIGGGFIFTCDGSKWYTQLLGDEAQTVTIA